MVGVLLPAFLGHPKEGENATHMCLAVGPPSPSMPLPWARCWARLIPREGTLWAASAAPEVRTGLGPHSAADTRLCPLRKFFQNLAINKGHHKQRRETKSMYWLLQPLRALG